MLSHDQVVSRAAALASAVGREEFSDAISNTADLLRRFSVLALALHEYDKNQGKTARITEFVVDKLPHHGQQMCELRVSAVARQDELDVGTVVEVATQGPVHESFIVYFLAEYSERLRAAVQELKTYVDIVAKDIAQIDAAAKTADKHA